MTNEMVDEVKKKKLPIVIFKANFEKANDSVRWKFLSSLMKIMGFPTKWIMWIKECLEFTVVSVLVNGSSTEKFKMKKGKEPKPINSMLTIC